MRVRPLSAILHPDFNEVVVHFTGRAHSSLDADRRLSQVVESGQIIASIPYGNDLGTACFTESTAAGVSWLVQQRHFAPYGIAFTKPFLFAHGGSPALAIRGDEWHHVRQLPPSLRARAIRLWPGAAAEEGETLPHHLQTRSEWLIEREWRLPADAGSATLSFGPEEIAFLVVPNPDWIRTKVRSHVKAGRRDVGHRFAGLRWISMSSTGEITATNGVRVSNGSPY